MSDINDVERMRILIAQLNKATEAYDAGQPIMTDKEWDTKYFELKALEEKQNIVCLDSPTNFIHFIKVSELDKVAHNHDMLSLNKTKDLRDIATFIQNKPAVIMAKMDGLTCSLTYRNGLLIRAETRGDGYVGEDVYHNIMKVTNVPKYIPIEDRDVVVDGEIIMTFKALEDWNLTHKQQYSNPRNTASGAIRRLDSKESAMFNLSFVAWDLINGLEQENSFMNRLVFLSQIGFDIVPVAKLDINDSSEESYRAAVNAICDIVTERSYPIDGCVFKYDDVFYGESLGATAHHKNNAMAYKFYDDTYPSTLTGIDWTMGRTGILTPVAKFEPIEIDGTIVERASLHNLSILKELFGGVPRVGDTVNVFKANAIIPQIDSVVRSTEDKEMITIPDYCPYCGEPTDVFENDNTEGLMCNNPNCEGKIINKMNHYCGKKGMDIKGLSSATIEKLIDWGFIENLNDIYNLSDYKTDWINKPGFGPASVNKILTAIDESKDRPLAKFIAALGIPLVGPSVAKLICKYVDNWQDFINKVKYLNYDFTSIGSIGDAIENSIKNYDYSIAIEMAKHLNLTNEKPNEDSHTEINKNLEGLTFVITGKIKLWKNRDELSAAIADLGGKVSSTVSSKTSYLIANEPENTTKYQKAQSMNIPIITEVQFIELIKENSSNG